MPASLVCGFGPGIAERAFVDFAAVGIGFLAFAGLAVEVLDQRRAVVLLDEVDDRLGKVVLPREVGAVLHVGDDHQRAHRRHQRVVAVVALPWFSTK